uniref:Molybdopterin synthase catalytic subunit n=1 Tax=Tetraselmis sp. GSL018 TaxID=582737 RepID=A0A061RE70_9CHLO
MAQHYVEISCSPLDIQKYITLVEDDSAGAISTFVGVTRDDFQGKKVKKLEYEAYEPMAQKCLELICKAASERWGLVKMAIAHRTGECLVREPSVVIAASSAHRRDSLEAVQWAIDELKATVPIWKKEYFEGGEVWKENAESRKLRGAGLLGPGGKTETGCSAGREGHFPSEPCPS